MYRPYREDIAQAFTEYLTPILAQLPERYQQVPVDLDGLAQYWNIPIDRADVSSALDGFTGWPSPRHPHIFLNTNKPLMRQRFTLAHELTHAYFHSGRGYSYTQFLHNQGHLTEAMQIIEIEANTGAAQILLPRSWFQQRCQDWHGAFPWSATVLTEWMTQTVSNWAREALVSQEMLRVQMTQTLAHPPHTTGHNIIPSVH